ncbi:hypothetical protein CEXT_798401 [Caerostris extrusa]|uniref:Uncharacterized protein n=1 Tax=Caerostris extrusa TaxID=172846 RepID=A0AAV4WVX0_CAEEX|nr:hypothetical protein CEXT_798401 [Caerostris extrusa]
MKFQDYLDSDSLLPTGKTLQQLPFLHCRFFDECWEECYVAIMNAFELQMKLFLHIVFAQFLYQYPQCRNFQRTLQEMVTRNFHNRTPQAHLKVYLFPQIYHVHAFHRNCIDFGVRLTEKSENPAAMGPRRLRCAGKESSDALVKQACI